MPTEITLKGLWLAAVALAFGLLLIAFGVQTVRLEGFKVWPVSVEGWKPKAERLQRDLDAVKKTQKDAADLAHQQRLAEEAKSQTKADTTDAEYAPALEKDLDSAERYIAAHRLPAPAPSGAAGEPGATSEDHGAQGVDGPGAPAELASGFVAVSDEDVRTCTANTARLVAARNWALHLND